MAINKLSKYVVSVFLIFLVACSPVSNINEIAVQNVEKVIDSDENKSIIESIEQTTVPPNMEQLYYVDMYYSMSGTSFQSATQMYAYTAAPYSSAAKGMGNLVYKGGTSNYEGNKLLDLDEDENVTLENLDERIKIKAEEFSEPK